MIKLIHDANLPLVALHTRDTLNVRDVLKHLCGRQIHLFDPKSVSIAKEQAFYYIPPRPAPGTKVHTDWVPIYTEMVKQESTLFVINPIEIDPLMFDGGEVPVPREMVEDFLLTVVSEDNKKPTPDEKDKATRLTVASGGLTIKENAEIVRLTMARDHSLDAPGIIRTRQEHFAPQDGLTFVDPRQDLYIPNKELAAWTEEEREFFLTEDIDHRLVPRGLLFDGPPGTGKTAGAKYVANTWGVSLYRLDLGATKSKWQGESERQLIQNLGRLDHEQPCVLLMDEVEKTTPTGGSETDGGVGLTMLSQILWWLAEHRSRVLTIMTTNNKAKLPPEFYRQGRIDEVFYFGGVTEAQAFDLACQTVKTFGREPEDYGAVHTMCEGLLKNKPLPTNPPTIAQASVVTATYAALKKGLF